MAIADTTSTFDYDQSLASMFSQYNPTTAYQTYPGYNYLQVSDNFLLYSSFSLFSPSNRRLFSVIQHFLHHLHGLSQCCPLLLFLLLLPSVSNFVPQHQHTLTRHRPIHIPIWMLHSDRIYNNHFNSNSHNHRLVKKEEMEGWRRVFRKIYRVNASVVEFLFLKNWESIVIDCALIVVPIQMHHLHPLPMLFLLSKCLRFRLVELKWMFQFHHL